MVTSVAKGRTHHSEPDYIACAEALAEGFAARAAEHDRAGSFPFENFRELSEAGLLSLTVPAAFGGAGAGARYAARVLGIVGKACSSTALVLSMHYINHLVMARSPTWPARLSRRLALETVEGLALINALRVEPELGSPARGGVADPEMVSGLGADRRGRAARRTVSRARGPAGNAHRRDLGSSRPARQRQP
jgi:hypothetical protein